MTILKLSSTSQYFGVLFYLQIWFWFWLLFICFYQLEMYFIGKCQKISIRSL